MREGQPGHRSLGFRRVPLLNQEAASKVRTTWWPSGAGRPMSQGDGRISPRREQTAARRLLQFESVLLVSRTCPSRDSPCFLAALSGLRLPEGGRGVGASRHVTTGSNVCIASRPKSEAHGQWHSSRLQPRKQIQGRIEDPGSSLDSAARGYTQSIACIFERGPPVEVQFARVWVFEGPGFMG